MSSCPGEEFRQLFSTFSSSDDENSRSNVLSYRRGNDSTLLSTKFLRVVTNYDSKFSLEDMYEKCCARMLSLVTVSGACKGGICGVKFRDTR